MLRSATQGLGKWKKGLSIELKKEMENHWKNYVMKNKDPVMNVLKPKYYVLSMFPYPSGNLHMGHVRVYTISDSIARFKKMNGMNVIHPMGWDAFGLPAENAAIEKNVLPNDWTKENILKMKEQLSNLGCNFDWDREINTSTPEYYKWTQALFLEMFRAGLVYKREAFVNWDPIDKTVLADEQVDENGCSWRSGAKVEKKLLNQWFIKTTYFAKQLYDGLNDPSLEDWKDVIQLQSHWIGECNGITVDFKLSYANKKSQSLKFIKAWTEYPETLLNAKFLIVPPDSILNSKEFIIKETDKFKQLSVLAFNPITNQNLSVFVVNEYNFAEGAEAHIGCPEINEIDLQFAKMFNLPVDDKVISDKSNDEIEHLRQFVCETAQKFGVGGYPVSSKLKDWLISRQRYWGTPIPIINCSSCNVQPVPITQLPVILPNINELYSIGQHCIQDNEWIFTECPSCGMKAKRETDTMDTFVDSSWYFLRYLDPKNENLPFLNENVQNYMPVDLYIGGKEHAVLHLYYARFFSHFLHSIKKLPNKEPFKRLLVQGMVMGKSYKIKQNGKYIPKDTVRIINESENIAETIDTGLPVIIDWEKMSKSKFNGVDPTEIINEYGCDTTRLLILANVPPQIHRQWSTDSFPGILNWQKRIWTVLKDYILYQTNVNETDMYDILSSNSYTENEKELRSSRNYFISSITFHYNHTYQLSVAISRMQGLTNCLKKVSKEYIPYSKEFELLLASQIIMLAPIAPHFSSELWSNFISVPNKINYDHHLINWNIGVLDQIWPIVDHDYELEMWINVDGNNYGVVKLLPRDLNKLNSENALDLALDIKKVKKSIRKGIKNVKLSVYPNCKAYFVINTTKPLPKNEEVINEQIKSIIT